MTASFLVSLAIVPPSTEGAARLTLWEELDRALAQRTDTGARAARRLGHRLARRAVAGRVPTVPHGRR